MPTAAATVAVAAIGAVASNRASRRAANTSAAGARTAADAQNRALSQSQRNLQPFLDAAVSSRVVDVNGFRAAVDQFNERIREIDNLPISDFEKKKLKLDVPSRPEPSQFVTTGALDQFQSGLNQAPNAPTIDQFNQQSNLQQFNAPLPQLNNFNFDPTEALNNPALEFQRSQGERQLDRIAGKNRQLNSGQRLIDAVKFGQGLASQSIGDEFNRQSAINSQNNQVSQQNFGNQGRLNQLQNSITGQNLSNNLNISNVNQNRLLQQFGLENNQFNNRLDRLGSLINVGAQTGQGVSSLGASTANNLSNIAVNGANTQAAAQIGQGNILNGFIQQGAGALAQGGFFTPQPQQLTQFGTIPGSQQSNLLLQQQQGFS